MFTVVLEYTKKPADRLLIIVMFLTLYNGLFGTINILSQAQRLTLYLLNAVNELVASILGEIIFYKNFAALVYFIACLVFMFLRNKIGQAVLIVNFKNMSNSLTDPILAFKFCKRPVRPDFLASPLKSASVVLLLNRLN